MKVIKKLIAGAMILPVLSGTTISGVYADDLSDVVGYVSQVQATDPLLPNVTNQKGVIGSLIGTVFGVDGKIKSTFLAVLGTMSSNDVPRWNGTQLVSGVIEDNGTNVGIGQSPTSNKLDVLGNIRASSKLLASEICDENGLNCGDLSAITFGSMWFQNGSDAYYNTGNVGIGTNIPGESLSVVGRISITQDPNTGDDLGDRDYNDTRYLNVGESGDSIADGTIDSSEIQNNSITESDISDFFIARDSYLLDGKDTVTSLGTTDLTIPTSKAVKDYIDGQGVSSLNDLSDAKSDGYSIYLGVISGTDDGTNWNVGIGRNALINNTSGYNNASIGGGALRFNTTGSNNTAYGYNAMYNNQTSWFNTAIGYTSMQYNTTGTYNVGVGAGSLFNNTTGQQNAALGYNVMRNNGGGFYNTAVGSRSLYSNVGGNHNVVLGNQAGYSNVGGDKNVYLGYQAGYHELGSNKLYITNSSDTSPLVYGDFSTDEIVINGRLSVTSDPNSSDDIGDRGYNDARYIEVGEVASDSSLLDGKDTATTVTNTNGTIPTSAAVKTYVDAQSGGGFSSCTTRTTTGGVGVTVTRSCSGGETMTGGGCSANSGYIVQSYPSGNGWRCHPSTGFTTVTSYARCCN